MKKKKRSCIVSYFSVTNHQTPLVKFWADWATWQSPHGETTERHLRTRCPQSALSADFRWSPASANSVQSFPYLFRASSWNDNNCEADIPGRMFLDVKNPQTSGPRHILWVASQLVMVLVLHVSAGNQRTSVKCLFQNLLLHRQRQPLRIFCIQSTCMSWKTRMYLKGKLWF